MTDKLKTIEEALLPLAKIAERVHDSESTRLWVIDSSIDEIPSVILTCADAHKAKQALADLAELRVVQDKWVNYKSDMRPETRNEFLRACSLIFDKKEQTND